MHSSLVIDFIHQIETLSKTKVIPWGQVLFSKNSENVCQSYLQHLLWESPLTCFLFSHKNMETPPQMLNWSRQVFDWSWVHKHQGSEGHFYHFTHAGSTPPLWLFWLWDLHINTSLWEGCGHLKLLPIIGKSTVLLWTPATPLRAPNTTISVIEGEGLGVLL